MSGTSPRRALFSPACITIAAFFLRVGFAWDYQRRFARQALATIPFLFESGNIAHSLAVGRGFASPFRVETGPTAWMTPLYPTILAAFMRLFGPYTFPAWVAAISFNICWSALACIPIYWAARRIGAERMPALAPVAAWLWAIFPNAIQLSYQSLWDTSFSACLGATLLWATLAVADSKPARDWAAYGLLWGIALMTNASFLSLLPLLLAWAAWRSRKSTPTWTRNAGLAAVLIALCCVPWTVRNYRIFHTFVPLRSVLGLQLWVGNNADAKIQWRGEQHPIHDAGERAKYIAMGEVPYMAEKQRNAVAYILSFPKHEAELIAGRFVVLWSGGSLAPANDFLASPSWWFRYVLFFNVSTAFAALGGVIVLFRSRSPFAIPASVYVIVFPWAYYMTLAMPRYRSPIDPVLMLLAAVPFCFKGAWLRNRSRTPKI